MSRILIVEDEQAMRVGLEDLFTHAGHRVLVARDGEAGIRLASEEKPDLIILDVMLPGMDGFDACRELRRSGYRQPILMLTARADEVDKVVGLELGADDYVTKPFSDRELLARVKALLRRPAERAGELEMCEFGTVRVDFEHFTAEKNGKPVELTSTEFSLLHYLVSHPGSVITREELLNNVWGYEVYPQSRTVDTHIQRLRQKIEDDPRHPKHILTVHGLGYRFVT